VCVYLFNVRADHVIKSRVLEGPRGAVRKCLRNTGDVRGNYLIIQVAGILLHIRGVSTVLETDVVIIYQSIRIGLTAYIETIRC